MLQHLGFRCLCRLDLTLTPSWLDIDECKTKNGGCHSQRKCTNTIGSMKCEKCKAGWVNDGAKGCKGVRHLLIGLVRTVSPPNTCCCPGVLFVVVDGFGARHGGVCFPPHVARFFTLTPAWLDIDECKTKNGGCHSKRTCTNTPGSMKCEPCKSGLVNDGAKGCKGVSVSQLFDWVGAHSYFTKYMLLSGRVISCG